MDNKAPYTAVKTPWKGLRILKGDEEIGRIYSYHPKRKYTLFLDACCWRDGKPSRSGATGIEVASVTDGLILAIATLKDLETAT